MRVRWGVASALAGWLHSTAGIAAEYQIPFAPGASVMVSQGFHGSASHTGDSAYSVDFAVPEGTPIFAAREGVVIQVEESRDGAALSLAYLHLGNKVVVYHHDGSAALYGHLKWHGAKVRVGERVHGGTVIGLSGNTGYSGGPHLHFSVQRPAGGSRWASVPFRFVTQEGPGTEPVSGKRYWRPDPR